MNNLKKLLFLLNSHEKKNAFLLIIMVIIMALIDMLGVASIMPFVAVITNPSLIETNFYINSIFLRSSILGVTNEKEFFFLLGALVFILLVFSLSFKALTIYLQTKFIHMREYSLSKRLVETYLQQPYSWFLNRNSSEIGKNILSEANTVIMGSLSALFSLITQSIVSSAMIILLLFVNLKLTLTISFVIGLMYVLVFYLFRVFLDRIGKESLLSNEFRYKSVNEAFGAIKEIKFGRLEKFFINSFSKPAENYAKNRSSSAIIGQLPRFFIEIVAFGGMLLIMLSIMRETGAFASATPVIAVYAYAGYRLIPSIQQIYQASSLIKYCTPSVNKLYNDLKFLKLTDINFNETLLKFENNISLNNVEFSYPGSTSLILKNLNIIIPHKSTVGFIGSTGSGKTTLIDIVLGLLKPTKGSLKIDDTIITDNNLKAWQSLIGYVPQNIYLSDNSIAANIAFGFEQKKINQELIEKAAKIANIHSFIVNELPDKYQTIVGERGIRLSGGQKQRIGIARALYHDPKVLVLDEATSALDDKTEKSVVEGINQLSKHITIIIIAHRLNTIKNCDIVYKLEKGQLIN